MLLNCGIEPTLENPLDCKEILPVHPKGNQSWIFTGRIDAEAKAPILWPPKVKSWSLGKTLMLGTMEDRKRIRVWQMMRWLNVPQTQWIWISKLREIVKDREAWRAAVHGVVPSPVLAVASWPAYRFLRRQVRWFGIPISLRIFQFVVIHTAKGFHIVHLLLKPSLKDF